MNINRKIMTAGWLLLTAVLLFSGWVTGRAQAHGTDISYEVAMTVTMQALFDNGEPMRECQFTVYAPNDPATPWTTGACDGEGYLSFTPDPSIPGNWAVSIRQAGHGEIVNVPIEAGGVAVADGGSGSSLQTILTGLATVWGFIGTALYFSARTPQVAATKETVHARS